MLHDAFKGSLFSHASVATSVESATESVLFGWAEPLLQIIANGGAHKRCLRALVLVLASFVDEAF